MTLPLSLHPSMSLSVDIQMRTSAMKAPCCWISILRGRSEVIKALSVILLWDVYRDPHGRYRSAIFRPVGRLFAFGKSFTRMYSHFRLAIRMIGDFPLEKIAHCWPIFVAMLAKDTARF